MYLRKLKDDRSAVPFYLQAAKAGAEATVGLALFEGNLIERMRSIRR